MSNEAREYQKIVRIHGRDSEQAREFLAEHNGDWILLNQDAPSIDNMFERFANLTNMFKSINPNELSSTNPLDWEYASNMLEVLSTYFALGKLAIDLRKEDNSRGAEMIEEKMSRIYESLPIWLQW